MSGKTGTVTCCSYCNETNHLLDLVFVIVADTNVPLGFCDTTVFITVEQISQYSKVKTMINGHTQHVEALEKPKT